MLLLWSVKVFSVNVGLSLDNSESVIRSLC